MLLVIRLAMAVGGWVEDGGSGGRRWRRREERVEGGGGGRVAGEAMGDVVGGDGVRGGWKGVVGRRLGGGDEGRR